MALMSCKQQHPANTLSNASSKLKWLAGAHRASVWMQTSSMTLASLHQQQQATPASTAWNVGVHHTSVRLLGQLTGLLGSDAYLRPDLSVHLLALVQLDTLATPEQLVHAEPTLC